MFFLVSPITLGTSSSSCFWPKHHANWNLAFQIHVLLCHTSLKLAVIVASKGFITLHPKWAFLNVVMNKYNLHPIQQQRKSLCTSASEMIAQWCNMKGVGHGSRKWKLHFGGVSRVWKGGIPMIYCIQGMGISALCALRELHVNYYRRSFYFILFLWTHIQIFKEREQSRKQAKRLLFVASNSIFNKVGFIGSEN